MDRAPEPLFDCSRLAPESPQQLRDIVLLYLPAAFESLAALCRRVQDGPTAVSKYRATSRARIQRSPGQEGAAINHLSGVRTVA